MSERVQDVAARVFDAPLRARDPRLHPRGQGPALCTPRDGVARRLMRRSGPVAILAGAGQLPLATRRAPDARGPRPPCPRDPRLRRSRGSHGVPTRPSASSTSRASWRPSTVGGLTSSPSSGAVQPAGLLGAAWRLLAAAQPARGARGDRARRRSRPPRRRALLEERGLSVVGAHELAPGICSLPRTAAAARRRTLRTRPPSRCGLDAPGCAFRLRHRSGRGRRAAGACSRSRAPRAPTGCCAGCGAIAAPASAVRRGARAASSSRRRSAARTCASICRRSGRTPSRSGAGAGLSGIAVGAGSSLVVDRKEALAQADAHGLFLVAHRPALDGAPMAEPLTVFIVAGEESGDQLGAQAHARAQARFGADGCALAASAARRWRRKACRACFPSTTSP